MNDINELTIMQEINNIENAKTKYFFWGFIISLIPYSIVLFVADKMNASNIFIYTIIAVTILSSIANAFILSNNIHHQLIDFFETKYETDYKTIKESLK